MSDGPTYRAICAFVTKVAGKKRHIRKGEVVGADDPLVHEDGRPELFVRSDAPDDEERRALVALTSKPSCVACGRRFERQHHIGRPPSFCSEKCRKTRKRALNRAQKAIARGTIPSDLDSIKRAIADAELLRQAWSARGDAPVPLERPTPKAMTLLSKHEQALLRARKQAAEELRKDREKAAREATRKRWKEAAKADADAEREARQAILKAAKDDTDDTEEA